MGRKGPGQKSEELRICTPSHPKPEIGTTELTFESEISKSKGHLAGKTA